MVCADDCDDGDPATYPGAADPCDGVDQACDGLGDEVDSDGDGYMVCAGDCNDTLPNTFPGAAERCDLQDNDCDGQIDEGPCLLIEALILLGLASALLPEEPPQPEPQEEGGGGDGGCGCALYSYPIRSGVLSSGIIYFVPVVFILIMKRKLKR